MQSVVKFTYLLQVRAIVCIIHMMTLLLNQYSLLVNFSYNTRVSAVA